MFHNFFIGFINNFYTGMLYIEENEDRELDFSDVFSIELYLKIFNGETLMFMK